MPQRCISDFFLPKTSGKMDTFGCSIVTVGTQASDEAHKLFKGNAYSDYLYLHGLRVETAEALAELWHRRLREEPGIAGADSPEIPDWFPQQYQRGPYSFGFPAG